MTCRAFAVGIGYLFWAKGGEGEPRCRETVVRNAGGHVLDPSRGLGRVEEAGMRTVPCDRDCHSSHPRQHCRTRAFRPRMPRRPVERAARATARRPARRDVWLVRTR